MARFIKYNLLAIFAILSSTAVLVSSLPTSVLVDAKQTEQTSTAALNKESQPLSIKSPSEHEHGKPITADKTQSKIHAQKRGVKQSFYEGMPSDVLFNNNVPAGIWDEPEENIPFNEFQDLDDYPNIQYYQPAFSAPPHHLAQQQQQRPYDNFQHIMSSDNLYDEPLALPVVKYKYPTRFFDERRKRGVNKNIMRLKRDSTKLNSADMLALLSFLEANQRNRYDNANDELNSLEYQKPFYGPYGNFDGANNNDDDAAAVNGGEWWNEWIEPSVQFYGNSRNHLDENARKRLTAPVFPAKKRFMVAKKKRSLNVHHGSENDAKAQKKSSFSSRFTDNA